MDAAARGLGLYAARHRHAAERRAYRAIKRLSSHSIVPPSSPGLKLSAYGIATGFASLIGAVWLLYV